MTRLGRKERAILQLIRDAGSIGLHGSDIVRRTSIVSRWTVYSRLSALVDAGLIAEVTDPPMPPVMLARTRHVLTDAGYAALCDPIAGSWWAALLQRFSLYV